MNTSSRDRRSEGFSLVELMVVILIMGILAALMLPTMLNARKGGNEASAISALRTINSAQEMYHARVGRFGTVSDLTASGYLDTTFDAARSGYVFSDDDVPDRAGWSITAIPAEPGTSGDRHFYIDTSGVIRFEEGALADATSNPVQ
ncbi:MAG: type IV pilin protein [Planctomycetota bacterium]